MAVVTAAIATHWVTCLLIRSVCTKGVVEGCSGRAGKLRTLDSTTLRGLDFCGREGETCQGRGATAISTFYRLTQKMLSLWGIVVAP